MKTHIECDGKASKIELKPFYTIEILMIGEKQGSVNFDSFGILEGMSTSLSKSTSIIMPMLCIPGVNLKEKN